MLNTYKNHYFGTVHQNKSSLDINSTVDSLSRNLRYYLVCFQNLFDMMIMHQLTKWYQLLRIVAFLEGRDGLRIVFGRIQG